MIEEEIKKLIEFHTSSEDEKEWNTEEIFETVKAIAAVPDEVHRELQSMVEGSSTSDGKSNFKTSDEKREGIVRFILETLQNHYQDREKAIGEEGMRNIEKVVLLRSIDMLWMDHLDQMEHLRDSVRLRAYGQRDPLVEYKNEGARLFKELQAAIRSQIVSTIFKVGVPQERLDTREQKLELKKKEVFAEPIKNSSPVSGLQPTISKKEVGRNDFCPCGATNQDGRPKKYKHCHGKNS